MLPKIFPGNNLFYYDEAKCPHVRQTIALTMDDAPCRQSDRAMSMLKEVRELLQEFNAKATFFLCTDYVPGHEEDLQALLRNGHEVANHGKEDRPYHNDTEEAFEQAFLEAEGVCERLRADTQAANNEVPSKWFRSPWAKMSPQMQRVVDRHGFTNVLTDCYGNDPWISDPDFIARTMLEQAASGSIAVIHVPERGFREYNLRALRLFLEGLKERNFRVVNLSTLHREAMRPSTPSASLAEFQPAWKPAEIMTQTTTL